MSTTVAPAAHRTTTDPAVPCNYGGAYHPPARIFHGGKGWCSVTCQRVDRGSETTVWRHATRGGDGGM